MQKQDILQKLESFVHGQTEALERVSRFLVTALYSPELDRPHRGTLLLPGVSGTGRQHLARVIAREFLGGESALISIDCALFPGAPGVVQQLLIERGRRAEGDSSGSDMRLVLVENIDRASPQVIDLWAHIFSHGTFDVDAKMRLDFRNCVFVITSAVEAREIHRGPAVGFKPAASEFAGAIDEIHRVLPAHFVSAIDAVAVFTPLRECDLERIAETQLESMRRSLEDRGIALSISPEIRGLIVRTAKEDPLGGARSVRRAMQQVVEYPIADLRASGSIHVGDDVVLETNSNRVVARITHRR
jgi:ATP-dependent Clp protease ATP-binding subunit ClpA